MKLISPILFLLAMIAFSSCSKDNNSIEPTITLDNVETSYSVIDGMLTFDSQKAYQKILKELASKDEHQILAWTNSIGLKSLTQKYNDLHDQLHTFETEKDFRSFIELNSEFWYIKKDENDEEELLTTTDGLEDYFANESFLFRIGDDVIDVREEMGIVEASNKMCNSLEEDVVTFWGGNCSLDRRLKLRAKRRMGLETGGLTAIQLETQTKAQRKRFCIWVNMRSALSYGGFGLFTGVYDGNTYTIDFTVGPLGCSNCYKWDIWDSWINIPYAGNYDLYTGTILYTTTSELSGTASVSCL